MPSPQSSVAAVDYIAGLAKGLSVLESFDTERQRLNATMAADRAGLTRAAARRHLLTLRQLGYLETDGSYYWLSPKVLRFSGAYLATARIPRAVQPLLNQLASQTGFSFSCAIREGNEVVIVARCTGPESGERLMAHGVHLGTRLPAHATSTGRMLLSTLPAEELEDWLAGSELARLTSHTQTDTHAFTQILDEVRRLDYCMAREEYELSIQALAVPLRDMHGRTAGALNVVASTTRISADRLIKDVLPLLQEGARTLRPLI